MANSASDAVVNAERITRWVYHDDMLAFSQAWENENKVRAVLRLLCVAAVCLFLLVVLGVFCFLSYFSEHTETYSLSSPSPPPSFSLPLHPFADIPDHTVR